jgi:hypothetical protein
MKLFSKHYIRPLYFTLLLGIVNPFHQLYAQKDIKDSIISMSIITVGYTFDLPGGNLADRFGWNSYANIGYSYKTDKNLIFGVSGGYIFGGIVREPNVLSNITDKDGYIIGTDGHYADIIMSERGFQITLNAGKLFPFKRPNPNSGLLLMGGVGFLEHKIFFEDYTRNVPAIEGDYVKGYDRMTNGVALYQTFKYMHLGNRHLINYYVGFELTEGFTENRRPLNFDTMQKDNTKRIDLLYGITLGWMLPIYKRAPNAYYYY